MSWPIATLDGVRQLRVLAATLPGVAMTERVLDAPFDDVWAFVSDLERSAPVIEPVVRSARIVARDGRRLTLHVHSSIPPARQQFEVDLLDGFCWMQSRLYLVGMAAAPEGGRTRYGHLEGLPFRVPSRLRRRFRRLCAGDSERLARAVER